MMSTKASTKSKSATGNRTSRSRSIDDRLNGGNLNRRGTLESARRRSESDLLALRSNLRVKSQMDSLRRRGLLRNNETKKTAKFSLLEVREYPIILGDNPSCTDGPPITIDWAYDPQTQFILDVTTFERMRGDRRSNKKLLISRSSREKSLIRSGFSNKDIASVMRQVRKDKHYRMVSSQQLNMDNLHEATEKVTVGFKKMFAFKKSEYDRVLEEACSVAP